MKQCSGCQSFKKADNCIRCYANQKEQNQKLIEQNQKLMEKLIARNLKLIERNQRLIQDRREIKEIVNNTPYVFLQGKMVDHFSRKDEI